MSNLGKFLSQKMTQLPWISKSSVAREEHLSRRTVQRWCRLWETLPGRKDYQVTDAKGRVNLAAFRRFRDEIKRLERRGFPSGGQRGWSFKWERLMRALRDRKAFGRTLEDRITIIKSEIDAMTDLEQTSLIWHFPALFRPTARGAMKGAFNQDDYAGGN
jgi:hypothetical protein